MSSPVAFAMKPSKKTVDKNKVRRVEKKATKKANKKATKEDKIAEYQACQANMEELGTKVADLQANNTALGANNTALGANVAALGANNTAFQAKVVALQANNTALDANVAALGANNTALGDKNTALQANNTALGANVAALGANNKAFQAKVTALGANNKALQASVAGLEAEVAALETNKITELEAALLPIIFQELGSDLPGILEAYGGDLLSSIVEQYKSPDPAKLKAYSFAKADALAAIAIYADQGEENSDGSFEGGENCITSAASYKIREWCKDKGCCYQGPNEKYFEFCEWVEDGEPRTICKNSCNQEFAPNGSSLACKNIGANVVILPNSCNNGSICMGLKSGTIVGPNSCSGNNACSNLGSGDGRVVVASGACVGRDSCKSMNSVGGDLLISKDACAGESSCEECNCDEASTDDLLIPTDGNCSSKICVSSAHV